MYNYLIGLFLTALQVTCDITAESANICQDEKLVEKRALVSNVHDSSIVAVLRKIPKKSHGSIVCLIAVLLSNYCALF